MPNPPFVPRHSRKSLLSKRNASSRLDVRRAHLETLEKRELLAAHIALASFAPDTPDIVREEFDNRQEAYLESKGYAAEPNPLAILSPQRARWELPTGGPSPEEGDPATISWGIVPDGTEIQDANFIPGNIQTSNLIAHLDGIYGGGGTAIVANKPWFPLIERVYDMWADETGLTFVYEPMDDGLRVTLDDPVARGIAGVRPDMRVSGTALDGDFGLLGYNFFPDTDAFAGGPNNRLGGESGIDGDMVLDTNDIFLEFFADGINGENRALTNLYAHEMGHGIGMAHSLPVNNTKLMEPSIGLGFLGPQEEDLLTAHTLYGDRFEPSDQLAEAHDLGAIRNETIAVSGLSIHANNDVDLIRFETVLATELSVDITPTGSVYDVGDQLGLEPVTTVDRRASLDLSFRVLDSTGAEVTSVSGTPAGQIERLRGLAIEPGVYFIEVVGARAAGETQLYDASLTVGRTFSFRPDDGRLRLMSVNPNASDIFSRTRLNLETAAPQELQLRFSGDSAIDPTTLEDGIRITYAGRDGLSGTPDDEVLTPGYLGIDEIEGFVIARFAEPLEDGRYMIEAFGEGIPAAEGSPLRGLDGSPLAPFDPSTDRDLFEFELELGARVVAVVPQPVDLNDDGSITPQRREIEVYFDDDDLFAGGGTVTLQDPSFYQLIRTGNTATPSDDLAVTPVSVTVEEFEDQAFPDPNDPAQTISDLVRVNRVVLTFDDDLANLPGEGIFRLKVGSSDPVRVSGEAARVLNVFSNDAVSDVGNTAASAFELTGFGTTSTLVVDGAIRGTGSPFDYPGANGEPGTRDIGEEHHLLGADGSPGINIGRFNFALNRSYATLDNGRDLFTVINDSQIQRGARSVCAFRRGIGGRIHRNGIRRRHVRRR